MAKICYMEKVDQIRCETAFDFYVIRHVPMPRTKVKEFYRWTDCYFTSCISMTCRQRYYRFMSDTTVSISRNRPFRRKEIRWESSESDDRRPTKNTLNNRKMTKNIRSDLVVVSSRIFIPSDRIRPCEIDLG